MKSRERRWGSWVMASIGSAAAERARPFGMKIAALRRRPELFQASRLVDVNYPALADSMN